MRARQLQSLPSSVTTHVPYAAVGRLCSTFCPVYRNQKRKVW